MEGIDDPAMSALRGKSVGGVLAELGREQSLVACLYSADFISWVSKILQVCKMY